MFPRRQQAVKIDLTVGPFFSALRQAAIVASDDSRGIDFDFGKGTLLLAARNANLGESKIEMPIPYDGETIGVTLDHKFVADFLKVLKPEQQFQLEIENADAAALFTTDDGYAYVLMPLALTIGEGFSLAPVLRGEGWREGSITNRPGRSP